MKIDLDLSNDQIKGFLFDKIMLENEKTENKSETYELVLNTIGSKLLSNDSIEKMSPLEFIVCFRLFKFLTPSLIDNISENEQSCFYKYFSKYKYNSVDLLNNLTSIKTLEYHE